MKMRNVTENVVEILRKIKWLKSEYFKKKPDRFKYIVKDNILSDESEEIYKGKYEQVMAVFW